MSLASIKCDEETILEFDIKVYGTTDKLSEVRFIIESKSFDLGFKCESTSGGGVKVSIPKLKGIVDSGEHDCKLETIIGDRIFTPLKDTITIEQVVDVKVTKKKSEPMKPTVVEVRPVAKLTTATSVTGKSLNEAIQQGATVEFQNGANFLKSEGKYVGIVVNENKIIYSDPTDSIEELVDAIGNKI